MRAMVHDLLPDASFLPVGDDSGASPDQLATLPCILVPGQSLGNAPELASTEVLPISRVLGFVWAATFATLIAMGVLLGAILRLNDRRSAFVAAVTHELRTPLTTLRLYSEMLSRGMVRDETTRQEYLETLEREVIRIGHLLDNVFAFARLERGRKPPSVEPYSLRGWLERVEPKLHMLAARANMALEVVDGEAWEARTRVDPSVLEQILTNLVDNAGKYAREAADRRILLEAQIQGGELHLAVRDFGPGFAKFSGPWKPFFKTVEQAAESAPGIGLGLAISRQLAVQSGGRLWVDPISSLDPISPLGAHVVLVVPRATV
jgi:signal transduction histidine kinase